MRKDVTKIVYERGRNNRGQGYSTKRAQNKRMDLDSLPYRESMSASYLGYTIRKESKSYNSILKGFLARNLGRDWDSVWSEICSQTDTRTVSGQKVRDWFKYAVSFKVEHYRGRVYSVSRWCGLIQYSGFYLDKDKNLQHSTESDWRDRKKDRKLNYCKKDGIEYQIFSHYIQAVTNGYRFDANPVHEHARKILEYGVREAARFSGVWYWIEFTSIPEIDWLESFKGDVVAPAYKDIVTGKSVTQGVYRSSKHQMSGTDLELNCLQNTVPVQSVIGLKIAR